MTIVAFRKETDRLVQVCRRTFKNALSAKKFIEDDAQHMCMTRGALDLGWILPKTKDYYCVELKSGVKCFWQYFDI